MTSAGSIQAPGVHAGWVRRNLLIGGLLAILVAFYWSSLLELVRMALSEDTYSHILLVPFVTIGLLWMNRAAIFVRAESSAVPAISVFLAGALLYATRGRLDASLSGRALLTFTMLSAVVLAWSAFLIVYGAGAFRRGLFPLLFLLLAVPLPAPVIDRVILWLQQGSAEVTYWLFQATGTPVFRHGFIFAVPGQTIEIAQECSGIRSSLAMLITCLLAGYLFLRSWWSRLTLLVAAVPMLVIKNGIRIVTLTLLSIHVDPNFLYGRLHQHGGFLFFLLGLVILWPLLLWLQRLESKSGPSAGPGNSSRKMVPAEPPPGD